MKTAKAHPAAYYVTCPHCDETLANSDNGSLLWDVARTWPETVDCPCGQTVKVPAVLR